MNTKRSFSVVIAAVAAFIAISGFLGQSAAFAQSATASGKFTTAQYKKALWMVTRFYGAQRSGVGPNWLLMDHTYKTSFTNDALDGNNLEGGWFDCGDHVTFGQTFFYSAYMLARAYDAFPTGFHDLYHGKDYSDYAASGKWDFEGGAPNGIPDLLEELKYATDWIIKATPNGATFYYEKGNGGNDHKHWVTAGFMSTLPVNEGGEPRPVYKNPADGPMASFAAATLAIMSKIYRKYDARYADTCLNHAKLAYAYAKAHKSESAGAASGSYYGAGKLPANTFNIAAAEMFVATNDNAYKSDISLDKNNVPFHGWAFDYQNPHDMVPYAVAMADPENKDALLDAMNTKFITRFTGQTNAEKVSTVGNADWGALRYPTNHAFLAALYQGAKGTSNYDQFIYDQIDYVLGNNSAKQSFVVGFCEGCTKQATKPHHRNVYLNDDDSGSTGMAKLTIPERNKSFGYMVGGSFTSSGYKDDINSYQYTEGGLDYNAGLVGALAYIVSKQDPADTIKFGVAPPPPPASIPTAIRLSFSNDPANAAAYIKDSVHVDSIYNVNDGSKRLYAHIFDETGAVISNVVCDNITWKASSRSTMPLPPDAIPSPATRTDSIGSGCSVPAPAPYADAEITSILVNYVYAGANRPSIGAAVKTYSTPVSSVSHKAASLSKNGYSISVRHDGVSFFAADGLKITALSVYNIQGKRVFNRAGDYSAINWKSAAHPRGVYLMRMSMSNGAAVARSLMLK